MKVFKLTLQQTRWFTLSIIAFRNAHLISSYTKTKELRNSVKMSSEVLKLYLPSYLRPKIFVKLRPAQLTKRYLNIAIKKTPKKAKIPQTYAYFEPCQKSKMEFLSENS